MALFLVKRHMVAISADLSIDAINDLRKKAGAEMEAVILAMLARVFNHAEQVGHGKENNQWKTRG